MELRDPAGRRVDYLRISITDRCNERCLYCMPEGLADLKERRDLLSFEEVLRFAGTAARLGFRKFRITGGEPLVRRGAVPFLIRLAGLEGVQSVGLSTNATLLAPVAGELRRAGLASVNISLDTLDPRAYHELTRGELSACLAGIDAAVEAGFPSVKLNAVLLRGFNEGQIVPLVSFAHERGIPMRFIEWMPVTDGRMRGSYLPAQEAREILSRVMPLEPVDSTLGHGPARYYRWADGALVGFISAMSDEHFCAECNKVRLTADGKLRPCLGDSLEFDLRAVLRGTAGDDEIHAFIREVLRAKPLTHSFLRPGGNGRSMNAIGG